MFLIALCDLLCAANRGSNIIQRQLSKNAFEMILMLILAKVFKRFMKRGIERLKVLPPMSLCSIAISLVQDHP